METGAVGGAGQVSWAIPAELGDGLAGARLARTSGRNAVVFNGVGLALQDPAMGWLACMLVREHGTGRGIDFLAWRGMQPARAGT